MGKISPSNFPMGNFSRKPFAFHEFWSESHAVKKIINALTISTTCTIHFFALEGAISRTHFFFGSWGTFPHGEFPMGNFFTFLNRAHSILKLITCGKENNKCFKYTFDLHHPHFCVTPCYIENMVFFSTFQISPSG
jgi:hypothetical protein